MTTTQQLLNVGRLIAGDRADVTVHKGSGGARALRISGCRLDMANDVAREIRNRIRDDHYDVVPLGYPRVASADGFVAVWIR